MKSSLASSHPPRYYETLRRSNRWFWTWNLGLGSATIYLLWGYFFGRRALIFETAPGIGACYAFFLWASFSGWKATQIARVLPYFPKGDVTVKALTFSHGHALARYFENLEALASRINCEPLSTFGFNDDLHLETIIWHDAARGLVVVSRLAEECKKEDLPDDVVEDLEILRLALVDATRKNIPFCLHLRHGESWSGAEMDMRKGNFGFAPR